VALLTTHLAGPSEAVGQQPPARPVDGVLMRDWLASDFSAPATVTDQVEEGDLVQAFPGVLPFPCPLD